MQEMSSFGTNGTEDSLPPPPPAIPSDVVPIKMEPEKKKVLRLPMARRGLASKGMKLRLLTNHFRVNVGNTDGHFFQYSVCPFVSSVLLICIINFLSVWMVYLLFMFEQVSLSYEDGRPVEGKGVGRKVLDRVQETYNSELNGKDFAYDGEKTLFTLGSLARNRLEFTVVLEDVVSAGRLTCFVFSFLIQAYLQMFYCVTFSKIL